MTSEVARANSALTIEGICKRYGGVVAVDDVWLQVEPSQITGLIGPNGAGKSTLLGLITGFIPPDLGSVVFEGRELLRKGAHGIARAGIVRTFQHASPLTGLTTLENVLVGMGRSPFAGPHHSRKSMRQHQETALDLLQSVGLEELRDQEAADLSFGQLRLLEIARALATKPKFLLLDEPAAGLNQQESQHLAKLVFSLRDRGIGILLIDHDMPLVFQTSETVVVMNFGRVIATGSPIEMTTSEAVRSVYLRSTDAVERG